MKSLIFFLILTAIVLFAPSLNHKTTTTCQNDNCTTNSEWVLGDSLARTFYSKITPN